MRFEYYWVTDYCEDIYAWDVVWASGTPPPPPPPPPPIEDEEGVSHGTLGVVGDMAMWDERLKSRMATVTSVLGGGFAFLLGCYLVTFIIVAANSFGSAEMQRRAGATSQVYAFLALIWLPVFGVTAFLARRASLPMGTRSVMVRSLVVGLLATSTTTVAIQLFPVGSFPQATPLLVFLLLSAMPTMVWTWLIFRRKLVG